MSKKSLINGLLPFLTNPATILIAGIGITALYLFEEDNDNKEIKKEEPKLLPPPEKKADPLRIRVDQDRERSTKAGNSGNSTVQSTVQVPIKPGNPDNSNSIELKNNPYSHLSDEELKKELIRQTMSELGKRSGKARALKMK